MKVHAFDRRKHRVDRNHTNRQPLFLIPLGGHIAPPKLYRHFHIEQGILVQRRNMEIRGEDGHVSIMNNVRPFRFPRSLLLETERLRFVGMYGKPESFDVQNNGGYILRDTRNRGELVQDPFNLHCGDCRTC